MEKHKKICLYTCITGQYDEIHEIENKEENVDYLLFTNNKNLKSNTWKIIYIENEGLDNQRLSRKIKTLGHPLINKDYEISVWQDASVIFKKSIVEFVNTYLKNNEFAAFKHNCRNCIYDEAIECIRLGKDDKNTILKHVDFLKKEKYPIQNGLYEMTVFIKKHNSHKVKETMNLWFDMICNYSKRDQLSFMYCIWKTGLKISEIPLSVWNNEWFTCKKHNYNEKIENCKINYGMEQEKYNYQLDEILPYKVQNNTYMVSSKIAENTNNIEINISDVPCLKYSKLTIKGIKPNNIYYFNSINYNGDNIFYKNGIIQLQGNFSKGDKFTISINLEKLNNSEKYELIAKLSENKIILENKINSYKSEIESLKEIEKEYKKVINSKGWLFLEKLRSFRLKK